MSREIAAADNLHAYFSVWPRKVPKFMAQTHTHNTTTRRKLNPTKDATIQYNITESVRTKDWKEKKHPALI